MMRIIVFSLLCLLFCPIGAQRPRVLISTDIGGTDPDDNQSMIHLMMYSDLFQIEGLVSSPSFGNGSKEEILRMIDLYAKDYPQLKHGRVAGMKNPGRGKRSGFDQFSFSELTRVSRT